MFVCSVHLRVWQGVPHQVNRAHSAIIYTVGLQILLNKQFWAQTYGLFGAAETRARARKTRLEMAEPDRPPGQRSLFHFGVKRVAIQHPLAEVDRTEVETDVEAKRQARRCCHSQAARGPAEGQAGGRDCLRAQRRGRLDDDEMGGKPWKLVLAPSKLFKPVKWF
jgi:hypothetical protein